MLTTALKYNHQIFIRNIFWFSTGLLELEGAVNFPAPLHTFTETSKNCLELWRIQKLYYIDRKGLVVSQMIESNLLKFEFFSPTYMQIPTAQR